LTVCLSKDQVLQSGPYVIPSGRTCLKEFQEQVIDHDVLPYWFSADVNLLLDGSHVRVAGKRRQI
jgi:hypothetical protein